MFHHFDVISRESIITFMKKAIIISAAALAMGAALTAEADTYPRKVLVEHFTTMKCPNCPRGNNTLTESVKERDVVWVAHHVGYYTDELTAEDSNEMLYFGITGAPYAMIDRSVWESGELKVSIGYSNAVAGAKIVGGYIDKAAMVPANVGITITKDYNEETRDLTVTVSLERNADLPEDAHLTVQMVEDGVYAEGSQAGAPNVHRHNNVYRRSLTNILGDEIAWEGNTSTTTYTLTVPEEWNDASTRVVAFVNPPRARYQPEKNAVYNAEETRPLVETVVAEPTEAPVFTPAAGTYEEKVEVSITAAEGAEIYYTLDGSEPTEESTHYTMPLELTESATVKAIAYQEGFLPSETVTAEYVVTPKGDVGITTVGADASGEAEWFDLQGRRVDQNRLTPGIYVKRTGTAVERVAVK